MTAFLSPEPKMQFFAADGSPLVGGKLYSYQAGTTTPLPTYTSSSGLTPNSNPVIMDSRGEASVWLSSDFYKLKLTDANDVEIWTVDNIGGAVTPATFAGANGADLIGWLQTGSGAELQTVYDRFIGMTVELLDFVPPSEHAAILAGTSTYECATAMQAAVDKVYNAGGGTINLPRGRININTAINCYPLAARRLRFIGKGQDATAIYTTSDIIIFTHAESFDFCDASVYQTGTAKTGTAFATHPAKQAAYCRYERCTVQGFKFGVWWRYSLWCSVRDVRFDNCAVGLKASRNAYMNDQTNPAAPGSWNLDPGFFHNQDTFDNVLCNGGECGIWGTFNGAVFNNVTCQGQGSSTGAGNVALPVGQQGTGLYMQNSGGNTSTFGAQANVIVNYYAEFTRQPIILEYVQTSLLSVYYQGGPISNKYPQAIKVTGGVLNARGCNNTGSDWFDYRMVATDATIFGDPTGGTTAFSANLPQAYNLTNTDWYRSGIDAAITKQYVANGASTTTIIQTMDEQNTYSVEVVALYDGYLMRSARFQVAFYSSAVAARIISDAGNSSDITCTTSGSTLQINTTGSQRYGMTVTAVQNRKLGAFPYNG